MCFIISSEEPEEKIAKRDIVCYKRFDAKNRINSKYFYSPFMGFKYEKGQCYFEDEALGIERIDNIDFGFHSYSTKLEAILCVLHDEEIVKCIIPEGARYYRNTRYREYVSDYLIIGTNDDIIKQGNRKNILK